MAFTILSLTLISLASIFSAAEETAQIGIVNEKVGNVEERVLWIDVKRSNAQNQIVEEAKVRLEVEVKNYNVFVNGYRINHLRVNRIHMTAQTMHLVKAADGATSWQEGTPALVHVRVMVTEGAQTDLTRVFTIEEQIVFIDDHEFVQLDVKQVEIEMSEEKELKRIIRHLTRDASTIHHKLLENDMHTGDLQPSLPDTPLRAAPEDSETSSSHCWFHRLLWSSRIIFFAILVLLIVSFAFTINICCRRRNRQKQKAAVVVLTDDIAVCEIGDAGEDEKKAADDPNNYDFHFEFDHQVVVDDKTKLVV